MSKELYKVLLYIWEYGGITTKSDYARLHATNIGELSSLNMVWTKEPDGSHSNVWRLTPKAVEYLYERRGIGRNSGSGAG